MSLLYPLLLLAAPVPVVAVGVQPEAVEVADSDVVAAEDEELGPVEPGEEDGAAEFGPFFEGEPVSDTAYATPTRTGPTPVLSVRDGAFCFVEGAWCKASLIASASVAAGMRIPASDAGPDLPFAQFTARGGLAIRPLMLTRHRWHAWGLGLIGSWSRGTGSVTVDGSSTEQDVQESSSTTTTRIQGVNQIWLSQKNYGLHVDFAIGAARSTALTSNFKVWGTSAEMALAWGGWGGVYLAGDFLDRDTRVVFGFRGHGIAAAPIIALALAGLAIGGGL